MADSSPLGLPALSKSDKKKNECIINRGREHKGLTGSFSSNLGQRTSAQPCREPKAKVGANGFVKALVAKLESSDDLSTMSSMSNLSIESNSPRNKQAVSPVSSTSPDCSYQQSPINVQTAPEVDGCSLTLLKYRQYFAAEKPLYRCLDEQETKTDSCKARVILRSSSRDKTPSPESFPNLFRDSGEQDHGIRSRTRSGEATPHNASHINTEETRTSAGGSTQAQDGAVNERDPAEARAFWAHVREYLALSDDELESLESRSIIDDNKTTVVKSGEVASSSSPHKKTRSTPNVSVGSYFSPQKRKRFLSVEEKMSEIDEFFGIDEKADSL